METKAIHIEQCSQVKKDELMNEIKKLKQEVNRKKKIILQEKVGFLFL